MKQIKPQLLNLRRIFQFEMGFSDEVKDSFKSELWLENRINKHPLEVLHFEELRNPEQLLSNSEVKLFLSDTSFQGLFSSDDF